MEIDREEQAARQALKAKQKRMEDYIRSFEDTPVVWGESDCTTFAARWLEQESGIRLDLTPYSSREEAHRLIGHAGSLVALWEPVLANAGVFEAGQLSYGDVGIIDTRLYGQIGCIFVYGGVAVRTDNGVRIMSITQYEKAWSV